MMDSTKESSRDLHLLDEIVLDPDTTQANLAVRLGVAVGTVNWHIKRLIAKGYIKVKRAERRKLRYFITPEGLALRARLTMAYIENSMTLYRETRQRALHALQSARAEGIHSIQIVGEGDIVDVCRLTCLEQGFTLVEDGRDDTAGILEVRGRTVNFRQREVAG